MRTIILYILLFGCIHAYSQTASRLKAIVAYEYYASGTPYLDDSIIYNYSAGRGGYIKAYEEETDKLTPIYFGYLYDEYYPSPIDNVTTKPGKTDFDTAYEIPYGTFWGGPVVSIFKYRYIQAFNAANQVLSYEEDYYDTSLSWHVSKQLDYTYDLLGRIKTIQDVTYNTNNITKFTYDSKGNLISYMDQYYSTRLSKWFIGKERDYYYTSDNILLSEYEMVEYPIFSGKMDTVSTYFFTSKAGKVISDVCDNSFFKGTWNFWQPVASHSYKYNGDDMISIKLHEKSGNDYILTATDTNIFDAAHKRTEAIVERYVGDTMKYLWSYNAFGQPASEIIGRWDGTTLDTTRKVYYYYELYTPSTISVQNVILNEEHITISPNPFAEGFDINFDKPLSTRVLINITDITGHNVMDADIDKGTSVKHILLNMPPGIYVAILSIDGSLIRKKLIKK